MKSRLTKKTAGMLAAFALALGLVGAAASSFDADGAPAEALLMICNGNNLC